MKTIASVAISGSLSKWNLSHIRFVSGLQFVCQWCDMHAAPYNGVRHEHARLGAPHRGIAPGAQGACHAVAWGQLHTEAGTLPSRHWEPRTHRRFGTANGSMRVGYIRAPCVVDNRNAMQSVFTI